MGKRLFSGMFGKTEADGKSNDEELRKDSFDDAKEPLSDSERGSSESQKRLFEEAIEALWKRIGELETELKEVDEGVKRANEKVNQLLNESPSASSLPSENPCKKAETAQTLFLSAPTPDGVFVDFSPTEQIGKSIYRLTTDDGQTGSYTVLSTIDAISTALISLSQFIKPACKIQNAIDGIPKRIATVEQGRADFNGEAWVIRRKAVVRLE